MQTEQMTKDKTFNLRLDEQDRERLDTIAAHYACPAATAVRILIKREADRLASVLSSKPADPDPFTLENELEVSNHEDVLTCLDSLDGAPVSVDMLAMRLADGYCGRMWMASSPAFKTVPRVLNTLRRHGYIAKRVTGYVLTDKGQAHNA